MKAMSAAAQAPPERIIGTADNSASSTAQPAALLAHVLWRRACRIGPTTKTSRFPLRGAPDRAATRPPDGPRGASSGTRERFVRIEPPIPKTSRFPLRRREARTHLLHAWLRKRAEVEREGTFPGLVSTTENDEARRGRRASCRSRKPDDFRYDADESLTVSATGRRRADP
jgi:hypothetical protein